MRRWGLSLWSAVRFRFRRARVERRCGARLYACALRDSRTRALFEGGCVPDTTDGRLDCLTLHLYLYSERFQTRFEAVVRAMMEAFVRDVDRSLREMGTGDLSVGKKVKKLLSRVYGAFDAYRLARRREKKNEKKEEMSEVWHAALARNMPGADCRRLFAHARKVEAHLARSSLFSLSSLSSLEKK